MEIETTLVFPPTQAGSSSRIMCRDIFITDDNILENPESFTLNLFPRIITSVIIEPSVAVVIILDNDGK